MNARLCKEVAMLFESGYRPYRGEVDGSVYERLGCSGKKEPYWMHRWPILVCLGCGRRCAPASTHGFTGMLPIELPRLPQAEAFSVPPRELVQSKSLLRVDETAYCLGVSRRNVYDLIAVGVLVRHERKPVRVTAESVAREMERVEE